jgi:hypothetical protein
MSATSISFNVSTWKLRCIKKRHNRMKLIINLNKDEGVAFKNFSDVVKPVEINETEFLKAIFLTGLSSMQERLGRTIKQYAKDNRAELASSGIEVIEDADGNFSIQEAPTQEKPVVLA